MNSRRSFAVGISYAQSFIIFGGYHSGSEGLNSTEIVTEQGVVSAGPEMPEKINSHAVAVVNATTSIVTGGWASSSQSSPLTWFFNHVSQQFQPGFSLITGRREHASATIQDRVTNEDIVAVVGGLDNSGILNSTELLVNGESEWQQGKNHAKLIRCVYMPLCGCAFLM